MQLTDSGSKQMTDKPQYVALTYWDHEQVTTDTHHTLGEWENMLRRDKADFGYIDWSALYNTSGELIDTYHRGQKI